MWKLNQSPPAPSSNAPLYPEPPRPVPANPAPDPASRTRAAAADQAVISKGLVIKGEITGTEPLFVDGKVEGSINIPGERVSIGQNGRVTSGMSAGINSCIVAREIVVMGDVTGNISASDRVEIRAQGALKGDISTARISIEDGAYFRGGIDIRKAEPQGAAPIIAGPEPPKPI
jgi:cytoskeletal protein CcmA (bactofilin family)